MVNALEILQSCTKPSIWNWLGCRPLANPDTKVHGAYMGHTWGRQDPGGSHVGPVILAIWDNHYMPANAYEPRFAPFCSGSIEFTHILQDYFKQLGHTIFSVLVK